MATTKTLEDIITEQASIVCEQIEAAVSFAESEEDLRIECEKAIEVFRKEADLPELKGHHEVTIGKGRADSVYDYVFIEYKKPGRLKESNDTPGNREVIKQLQERAKAFKSELKRDPKELFGVGTDGNYFITGRYRSGRWEISSARQRSIHVVEDFLRKLSSLGVAGKPFLADYLAGDFGAESDRKLAREGIEKLYWRIRDVEKDPDAYPKAKVLFDQWRILFGEVCGYDIKSPSSKIKELGEFYGVKKDPNPAALLFAVHSYYALFMKFLAAEIATMFNPLSASFLARLHQTGSTERLREELRELEDGGIYRHLGIKNFLEGDLFSWYLDAWDDSVEKIIRQMVACLDEYDPKTLSIDPVESRDLLKKLYQQLFPKTVRHDLGEYYTPDWLAELVIERVGYDGNPDKRVLDPACGSGTFLVMAINKVREYAEKNLIPKHELLPKILNNIVGFDLNPLAVMAARTNYLMALREMLKLGGEIEIPVYLCDSIMTPAEYGELMTKEGTATGGIGKVQELKTSAARFMIPTEIAQSRQTVAVYTEELEHCVRNDYTEDEFISRLKGERIPLDSEDLHKTLYRQVLKLKKQNQNDIWARIIKNSFAPLFIERVDFVIGNPPWINWENLPEDYRQSTSHLWEKYQLRPEKGQLDRMRGGKKDLSMLFVYGAVDNYLIDNGILGFIITQTVFKTKGAGDGFRRFCYMSKGQNITYLRPLVTIDMSTLQPFEGATNRTAVFVCQKSAKPFSYPVTYSLWMKKRSRERSNAGGKFEESPQETLEGVLENLKVKDLAAIPVASNLDTSPWLTVDGLALPGIKKILGSSHYEAHEGVNTGGLNGCYWIQILKKMSDESLLIENLNDIGKIKIKRVQTVIESTHVYPLVRGRDISRWQVFPSAYILAPQDRKNQREGISEETLKSECPKTFSYLKKFQNELSGRADRKYYPKGSPFYTMRNMASYSLSEWKVMWPEVGHSVTAGVCGPQKIESAKPVLPDHTVVAVSCNNEPEADYICALLNSTPAQVAIIGYVVLHPSPHVLEHVSIPKFEGKNEIHRTLARLSSQAHQLKAKGKGNELTKVESQINDLAAKLWGITPKELKQIQKALEEM